MIIIINGNPGSGKSTVAKRLAKKLKYPRIYGGQLRRDMARKRGLTLAEFNTWSESHIEGDKIVDDYLIRLGKNKKNLVVESRTVWYFIPPALKIFLYIKPGAGARRIWSSYAKNKEKRNEDRINSLADARTSITKRAKLDRLRYLKHYGFDINKKNNYDLWLDVTSLDKDEEFQAVYDFVLTRLDTK
ncbi:AAA family ATPase [Candidatus Falkowbacteria bacterium]|nr:AAA family ATPase [Candidatus Falkowbacteria bacterium]